MALYKKMYNQATVGGPETTLGTAVARTARFPITGLAVMEEVPSISRDEVITSRGANRKNYVDAIDVSLTIPANLEACASEGMAFSSLLGQDVAVPAQVGCGILIKYTGSEASCKIVVSATTITSTIGDLGSEAVDSNFGTTGVITLSGFVTVNLLLAEITGYSDYTATQLFGSATEATTAGYVDASMQIKSRMGVIYFEVASGVYLHRFAPIMTNVERPTYSYQTDGSGTLFDTIGGMVVNTAGISADLKGKAAVSFGLIGTTVTDAGSASAVAVPSTEPLKFSDCEFYLAGVEYSCAKSMSADISNNIDGDTGHCNGSLYKSDHARGEFTATGSISVRTTTASDAERAKRLTGAISSLTSVFEGQELATSIPEMVVLRLPAIQIFTAARAESGIVIDTTFGFEAIDENSYDDMITVDMLTTDSAKYN